MMPVLSLKTFWRNDDGSALIEFGLLLPTLILFLGLSVEGGRTFWSYQTTITGVRDAARYLSRVVDRDICETGGSVAEWNSRLTDIVRNTQSGESLFPQAVSINAVTGTLTCHAGGYRRGPAPVTTVTASLSIGVPFAGLFSLMGLQVKTVQTTVTDSTRILGL